jgi:hypothetical protein
MAISGGQGYNVATSGSGGSAKVSGVGPVVADAAGNLFAMPDYAIWPLQYLHPDRIDGPPILRLNNLGYLQLGALIGANGSVTTDQGFEIQGCLECIIDKIIICHSSGAPDALAGGLYTRKNKGGEAILPATQSFAGLTGAPYSMISFSPIEAIREADFLYFSPTVANVAPITFDIYVFGRVIKPLEG